MTWRLGLWLLGLPEVEGVEDVACRHLDIDVPRLDIGGQTLGSDNERIAVKLDAAPLAVVGRATLVVDVLPGAIDGDRLDPRALIVPAQEGIGAP